MWWSVCYGSFNPRRRTPPRRLDDSSFHSLDWYSAHLLAVAIGILLLSVADAFFTLTLLQGGAAEVNPIMAMFIYRNVAMFAAMKMGITSATIVLMVMLARYRFMRLLQVAWVLYWRSWRTRASSPTNCGCSGFARTADLVILPGAVTFHIVPPWARLRDAFKTPLPLPSR